VVLLGVRRTPLGRIDRVRVRRALPPQDIAPATTFFFGGTRQATFSFDVRSAWLAQVELVNQGTQAIARTWTVPAQPGQQAHASWDGLGVNGVEPPGRYSFRLAGAARSAAKPAPGSATSFFFADHLFPIRGRHNLGHSSLIRPPARNDCAYQNPDRDR